MPDFDYGKTLEDGQHERHPVDTSGEPVAPILRSYRHEKCGTITRMPEQVAQTLARQPGFYQRMFCAHCGNYFPCGKDGDFWWQNEDGTRLDQKVGV